VATVAGVAIGQLIWATLAGAGLAGLVLSLPQAMVSIRLCGAGYLAYLGLKTARAGDWAPASSPALGMTDARALALGVMSDLANPKMALLFLSLFPQFSPTADANLGAFLPMGALFASMTFLWLALCAVIIARGPVKAGHASLGRALHAVLGLALVSFGVRLALSA
jgi:threonine/homoserine/homoserine lactone efflux protein